jgi:tRNA1Val (adenine37-N6)-methyltransferase
MDSGCKTLCDQNLSPGSFFSGRLRVVQPRSGYRFSIDAVLLAHLTGVRSKDVVLELGAGCGIVALMMAYRWDQVSIYTVEIQPELAELARRNIEANGMQARIRILTMDMQNLSRDSIPRRVDLVVTNPPYRPVGSGRRCADLQRALAREEIAVTLDQVLLTARRMLFKTGRLSVIYPAGRLVDLLARMRHFGLEPKNLRVIHSRPGSDAVLTLVEAGKGGQPGLCVSPPLHVYDARGGYSTEVAAMLKG